jgi:hypothetical protein
MNFKEFDRMPQIEMFPWWNKTVERWHGEKLDKSLTDREDICGHFGLETYKIWWFSRRRAANRPLGHLGIDGKIDLYRQMRADLFPWPVCDAGLWKDWGRLQAEGKTAVWVELDGFFWFPREVFGVERNLYASYDEPEFLHILNGDLAEYTLRVFEEVCKYCVPDMIMISEDMSYNNGPMVSKNTFNEFIAPYYKKILPFIKERNMLTLVDTDGNIHKLAEWFDEIGVDGFLPTNAKRESIWLG